MIWGYSCLWKPAFKYVFDLCFASLEYVFYMFISRRSYFKLRIAIADLNEPNGTKTCLLIVSFIPYLCCQQECVLLVKK